MERNNERKENRDLYLTMKDENLLAFKKNVLFRSTLTSETHTIVHT